MPKRGAIYDMAHSNCITLVECWGTRACWRNVTLSGAEAQVWNVYNTAFESLFRREMGSHSVAGNSKIQEHYKIFFLK